MSNADRMSEDLLAKAASAGLSEREVGEWRRDLDAARLALCGCKPGAIAAALSIFASAGLIIAFREARSLAGIGAAVLCAFAITVAAKVLGYRSADRRLAHLQAALWARIPASAVPEGRPVCTGRE